MTSQRDDECISLGKRAVKVPDDVLKRKLYMSHTGLNAFLDCRRHYYYKYVRRLELDRLSIPFVAGRVIHLGVSALLKKDKQALEIAAEALRIETKTIRKKHPEITADQETKLAEMQETIPGLLKAYQKRYGKFIREHEHLKEEVPFEYNLDAETVIVGKIDNLLRSNKTKQMFTHELKSTSYITVEYVRAIQTDAQSALYHLVLNAKPELAGLKKGQKMSGIIYDVARKPSIRQTKKETRQQFLARLVEWYELIDGQQRFHMESIKQPLISAESLLNTYTKATNELRQSTKIEDYYQNFGHCVNDWGFCEHYGLCHRGESEDSVTYRTRERFKVQDDKRESLKTTIKSKRGGKK